MKIQSLKKPLYIKAFLVFLGAVCAAALVYVTDNGRSLEKNKYGQEIIKRKGYGGGEERQILTAQVGDTEQEIEITVGEKQYGYEQLQEIFHQAGEELETLILGKNESLDEVRSDLNLITKIPDTGLEVRWELDNYEVMDVRGVLNEKNLKEEGTLVGLKAWISYGEKQELYEFYARVFPPRQGREELINVRIQDLLRQSEEQTKEEDYLILPQEVGGEKIKWSYPEDYRALEIFLLGCAGAVLLYLSDGQKQKKQEKERKEQMTRDYPQILDRLTLYMGAGMPIRTAWFKIAGDYREKSVRNGIRAAYEEMVHTMYEIKRGRSERESYENFGIRCGLACYRKFASVLSQNLKKGSKGLAKLLEAEAREAFEDRKSIAKKAGEEAGTKLLVPMFLMLAVVMAIMVIPAFLSIRI